MKHAPIAIAFLSNHFTALLPINKYSIPPKPTFNQYFKKFEICYIYTLYKYVHKLMSIRSIFKESCRAVFK